MLWRLVRSLARLVLLAGLLGIVWLVLQIYSEEELRQAALSFWAWWSTRLDGDLAVYWNPLGAAVSLVVVFAIVTRPIRRLFGRRGYHDSGYYDSGSDHDDGGDGGDD